MFYFKKQKCSWVCGSVLVVPATLAWQENQLDPEVHSQFKEHSYYFYLSLKSCVLNFICCVTKSEFFIVRL